MVTVAQVRARAAACPPGLWFAVLGIGAVGVLVWHEWANTSHPDDKWLDPDQPALQISPVLDQPCRAKDRPYPATLAGWSCSKVGDC